MRRSKGIKPQDILILLKLIVAPKTQQKELADKLFISQAEISHGIKRLKIARLLTEEGEIMSEACLEFLIHGLKYFYPAELGTMTFGIPTAYAHPDFRYVVYDENEIYVWPYAEGEMRGLALFPIYPTLPKACHLDEKLYTLASLIEMIRMGRARERQVATKELKGLIKGK